MTPKFPLAEMPCDGSQCACPYCGARAPKPDQGFVLHGCAKRPVKRGLGDMASSVLSAIGITPSLVEKITGKPCGCKKRAEFMNRIGRMFGIG